jgi:hypothetical protein
MGEYALRKVTILFPRLDVTFKEGPVPEDRGPIPPIRVHWQKMGDRLLETHRKAGDFIQYIEKPLWQFTPEFVESLGTDIVYVPHKSTDTFPVNGKEIRYYMQSVFPFQFYIDSKGFAGGASRYPFDFDVDREVQPGSFYAQMQARALTGESKFQQPAIGSLKIEGGPYTLFLCQIPHDETIKYHSDVSVFDAMIATCEATKKLNMPLIVKGHPVNPSSMGSLYQAAKRYDHVDWIDDVSIHDLIPKAHAVVVVNSGTGMEAMLHKRPVITFGRCEYDCVSNKATADNIVDVLRSPVFNEKEVRAFFESWYEWTYDTRNGNSFNGL